MDSNKITNARLIIGIVLITIGTLFLAENFNLLDFSFGYWFAEYIFNWKTIFIFIGIVLLINQSQKIFGAIFISIGIFGFIPELWPLILVGIGLYIIYRKNQSSDQKANSETIDEIAIFGGGKKSISSPNFKGGKITSIFGGSTLDFSNSQLANGLNVIEVVAIFGGSSIIVPNDWNIEVDVIPILGGFEDKRRVNSDVVFREDKKLLIKGTVMFGGGELRN